MAKNLLNEEAIRDKIDSMDYRELLYHWRFMPAGHFYFVGSIADYYSKRMNKLKNALSHEEQVRISKEIGWKLNQN